MTVLANDLFTDSDGVTLTAHTPTTGVAWVAAVSDGTDLVIATNRVRGNAADYLIRQMRLDKGTTYPNDYSVTADLVFKSAATDDYIYIGARSPASGTGGYYFGYQTNSAFRRFQLLKGAPTTSLGSYAYAFPAVDTVEQIELIVSGTTITGKVGGSAVISVTDSEYTAGYPKIYFAGVIAPHNATSVHIDNFSVTASNTADIAIYVSGHLAGLASGFRLSGDARVSPGSPTSAAFSWVTDDISWTATQGEINEAIVVAAINSAAVEGYVVGALDNKIIIGASVGVM